MNKAKTYKILFLFLTLIMTLVVAVSGIKTNSVNAETTLSPELYFSGNYQSLDFRDNNVVAEVKSGDSLSLKKEIVLNDLAIEVIAPSQIGSVKVVVTVASFDANGNMRVENKGTENEKYSFDSSIKLEYEFNGNGNKTLTFGVNGSNYVVVNGEVLNKGEQESDYYKVKNVDKTPAVITFEFDNVSGEESALFSLVSVDQKASDASGKYKQTFELSEDGSGIKNVALPRASIAQSFFTETTEGYRLSKKSGEAYTVSVSSFSVLGLTPSGNMYLTKGEFDSNGSGIYVPSDEANSKKIYFNLKRGASVSEMSFNICAEVSDKEAVIETYAVTVYSSDYENEAPKYKNINDVIKQVESFKTALNSQTVVDGHSVTLGEKIKIPSLENFVYDDMTSYSDMTATYHYITPSNDEKTTTSTKSIELSEPGEYKMFVTFEDAHGGSMTKEQFFTVNDDQTIEKGEYYDYVFSFVVNDDAPLSVEGVEQDNGYIGIKYTAVGFDVVASGYSTEYTLWYNSNVNANAESKGWKQIIKKSEATSEGANGFTYDELAEFDYDGELTFTPVEKGVYMIDCKVVSETLHREAEDFVLIKVLDKATVVKPANYWVRDNIVSVIFLGLGTLCLIGIIILLFVKPKDSNAKD